MARKPSRGVREPVPPEYEAARPLRAKTIVSAKGQVVLPKALRDALGWDAGTKLTVESTGAGLLLRRDKPWPPSEPRQVIGILKYSGPPVSIEDMNAAVLAEAARQNPRPRNDRN